MAQKRRAGTDLEALETAFQDLVQVWGAGGRVDIRQSSVRAHAPAAGADAARRLNQAPEAARTILIGQRKAWAADLQEAVIDAKIEQDAVVRVALVHLEARRVIRGAEIFDLSTQHGLEALKHRLAAVNGIVVRSLGYRPRTTLAALLTRCAPDHKIPVVQVAIPLESDYGQFLNGSFWIDMNITPGRDDILAHALMRALQVRSIRATHLTSHKLGYHSVSAVKRLHNDGADMAEIIRRTGLSQHLIQKWTGKSATDAATPANTPADRRREASPPAATARQRAKATHLVDQLPVLEGLFPDGWDADRRSASAAISRACEVSDALLPEIDAIARERKARSDIAEGASKYAASKKAGMDVADLDTGLEADVNTRIASLLRSASSLLGREVGEAELFPARKT